MYLIEPFTAYNKPARKKHWTELLEEENLFFRLMLEAQMNSMTSNDASSTSAGGHAVTMLQAPSSTSTSQIAAVYVDATTLGWSTTFTSNPPHWVIQKSNGTTFTTVAVISGALRTYTISSSGTYQLAAAVITQPVSLPSNAITFP